MADKITPEERRLIDEAIAAGKVTHCPPMQYSVAPEKVLDIRNVYKAKAENWKRGQRLRKADGAPPPETPEEARARAEQAEAVEAARKLDSERRAAAKRERAAIARRARQATKRAENALERTILQAQREARLRAILQAGGTQMQAAIELKVAPMTISRWVKGMRENGKL